MYVYHYKGYQIYQLCLHINSITLFWLFDFKKKNVFVQFTYYKLSIIVCCYLPLRFSVELFVSKGLIQAEPAVSKNVSTSTKGNKNENKIKAKLNNFI